MKNKISFLGIIIALLLALVIPQTISGNDITSITKEFTLVGDGAGTKIPVGATVIYYITGITEVRDSQDKLLMCVNDGSSKQIQVPKGAVSATHVFEVPDGSNINFEDDGRITVSKDGIQLLTVADSKRMNENDFLKKYGGTFKVAGIVPPNITTLFKNNTLKPSSNNEVGKLSRYLNNFFGPHVENAYVADVDYLGNFTAYWDVPVAPTSPYSDTYNMIWNGVEDLDQTDVIQPVLMYSQAGGWDCYAYYGADGTYFHSTSTDASVGDEIKGIINHGPLMWASAIFNNATGLGRSITATGVSNLSLNAFLVCDLEATGVWYNTQMPGDAYFRNMSVKDNNNQTIAVTWNPNVDSGWAANLSGLSVTSPNGSTVNLYTAN